MSIIMLNKKSTAIRTYQEIRGIYKSNLFYGLYYSSYGTKP
ncbi:hypothetical protein [Terribacillus sp. AE2B 122]|nr:hypothetical protein [Terribacillus sp. AE2B 122]